MPRGGYEPDRNNLAPRAGFAWTIDESARTVVRGGYGIYYNQGALAHVRRAVLQPAVLQSQRLLPDPRLPPLTLADPFPASFPMLIPQSATAYQRDLQTPWMEHWNVNVQRQLGRSRAARGRVRRLARPRPDLGARPESAGGEPGVAQPPAQSAVRRHHADRVARRVAATTRCSSSSSSAPTPRAVDAPRLHARQVDRRCVGVLHEHGRSELSAEQPRPGRRVGPIELRRAAPLLASFACRSAARHGSVWLRDIGRCRVVVTMQSGRPFTVALRPDIDNSNTGRSNLGFGVNDRPNVTRRRRRSTRRPRSGGSTPRRSRCRRSGRSATPAATS